MLPSNSGTQTFTQRRVIIIKHGSIIRVRGPREDRRPLRSHSGRVCSRAPKRLSHRHPVLHGTILRLSDESASTWTRPCSAHEQSAIPCGLLQEEMVTTPPTPSRFVQDWRGAQGLVHHGSCISILFNRHSNKITRACFGLSCACSPQATAGRAQGKHRSPPRRFRFARAAL